MTDNFTTEEMKILQRALIAARERVRELERLLDVAVKMEFRGEITESDLTPELDGVELPWTVDDYPINVTETRGPVLSDLKTAQDRLFNYRPLGNAIHGAARRQLGRNEVDLDECS